MPRQQNGAARQGARADGACHHRPRRDVRRRGFLSGLQGRGRQADHRLRGLCRHRRAHRKNAPAGGGLFAPDPPVRKRDRLPQSLLSRLRGLHGGVLSQAAHRLAAAEAALRGHYLSLRLHRGRDPEAHPAAGLYRREKARARAQGGLRRPVLSGDPEPRHRRGATRADDALQNVAGAGHSSRRHERRALSRAQRRQDPRRAALHPDRPHGRRADAHALRGRGILPQERGGDARAVRGVPERDREHPAHRRPLQFRL